MEGRARIRIRPSLSSAVVVTSLVLSLAGAASLPADVVAAEPKTISLSLGEAVIVRGPRIARGTASSECSPRTCISYWLRLAPSAWRLRVGIDHPDNHDRFGLDLRDPSGAVVASARHSFLETPEIAVPTPDRGVWTVDVIPSDVHDTSFDLRAKLERLPSPPPTGKLLRPNLRAEPGFDFSFTTPVGSNVGMSGTPSISCHPDEMAEDASVRCLRFSFGYQNAGDGPFDVRFEPLTEAGGVATRVRQRIFVADRTLHTYTDNEFIEQPAGTATYHEIHGHWHYDAVFQARLFEVIDPEQGQLEPLGEAEKRGACAHDWVLVDFERFYQDLAGTADSGTDCSFAFTNPTSSRMRIGLSRGWADIYTAELSDNYVDYGLAGDGTYLVRVWSDPNDYIRETNERDNVAYTLIEVDGDQVRELERGRGTAPWDPEKVVLRGLGD